MADKDKLGIVADSLSINPDIRAEKTIDEQLSEDNRSFEDRALRPTRLCDYIGQEEAKEQLAIALAAAKKRGEALDHVLIFVGI